MSWGYKILIVILLFIGGMLYMVYVAMQQDNEMLDDRYYEREVAFQSQIDASQRVKDISSDRLLTQNDTAIILQIPTAACSPIAEASMDWIRRDNMKADKSMAIELDDSCRMYLNKAPFEKGMYMVRVRWKFNAEDYFAEEDFFVLK
jgi:hypothetical protein